MLVLSRKENEAVVIDGKFKIVVVEIRGDRVRFGFDFPKGVTVHREEVQRKLDATKEGEACPQ